MQEWIEYGKTWEAFRVAGLAVVGVQVEFQSGPQDVLTRVLIGDINDLYGGCDHCGGIAPDVVIMRYRVVATPEELTN